MGQMPPTWLPLGCFLGLLAATTSAPWCMPPVLWCVVQVMSVFDMQAAANFTNQHSGPTSILVGLFAKKVCAVD